MITALLSLFLLQSSQELPPAHVPVTATPSAHQRTVRQPTIDPGALKAANNGLQTLKLYVNPSNYRQYGLDSADSTRNLELGNPLPVYFVSAKDLAKYTPGTDAGTLMRKTDRLLYPVLLDGKGVAVITIEKINGSWSLLEFGGSPNAGSLASASSQSKEPRGAKPGSGPGSYFAIQIPALKLLTFVAYSPASGPGGSAEQKRNVILKSTTTSTQLREMFGPASNNLLVANPSVSSETNGVASANQVFTSLMHQATKVANANVPQ